nr:hypothetical protein CFP56_75622 [Quercus suber]
MMANEETSSSEKNVLVKLLEAMELCGGTEKGEKGKAIMVMMVKVLERDTLPYKDQYGNIYSVVSVETKGKVIAFCTLCTGLLDNN